MAEKEGSKKGYLGREEIYSHLKDLSEKSQISYLNTVLGKGKLLAPGTKENVYGILGELYQKTGDYASAQKTYEQLLSEKDEAGEGMKVKLLRKKLETLRKLTGTSGSVSEKTRPQTIKKLTAPKREPQRERVVEYDDDRDGGCGCSSGPEMGGPGYAIFSRNVRLN